MKKQELVLFMTGRCKHSHKYAEHPACFVEEQNRELRIGYLDIETTNLQANFDLMLTWVIKDRDKDIYKYGLITKKELFNYEFDKRICNELIDAVLHYDIVITYYGTKFDVPFIRSRCLFWKLPFINFGLVKHKDVYYMVKRLLRLHRSSLDAATRFLGITGKNHVDGKVWMKARYGDVESLNYVLDHNLKDVAILEKLHKKLEAFDKGMVKSI